MNPAETTGTRFLASVRSAEEARIALSGGADIIDAKEPRLGALGAVALPEIAAIVAAAAGRRGVSATIGDCDCNEAPDRVRATAESGVDHVKVGLFGMPSPAALKALERCVSGGISLIAVMLADRTPDFTLIPRLAEAGFTGVMLDTAGKGEGLRAHLSMAALTVFLAEARTCGLLAGLAGSLGEADALALLPLKPDVMGFRGALCAGGAREGGLDIDRVRAMRRLLDPNAANMLAGAA